MSETLKPTLAAIHAASERYTEVTGRAPHFAAMMQAVQVAFAHDGRSPAVAGEVEPVAWQDIPILLQSAIVALERYDAPSRPAMLQLASHLRGLFEYPADAEESVRQCASLDENGYIAYKSVVIAALRACSVAAPPRPSAWRPDRDAAYAAILGTLFGPFDRVSDNTDTKLWAAADAVLALQPEGK